MAETSTIQPANAEAAHGPVAHPTTTGVSNEKLAMWVFLGSECLLFGGLISTYLLYKNRPGTTAGGSGAPERISSVFSIEFTSASSFVLLMSSLTMVLAVTAIQRRDMSRTRLWLAATALLGSIFVGGQVFEFTSFVKEGFGFTTDVGSSAFFTLTGFHGVHVTVGILILLATLAMTFRGRVTPARAETVEIVGLYWHFVDIVWILIFTIVYLIK